MVKQTKKKNQNYYQIYGLNGSFNVIQSKKVNILRIDIMVGGMAEKKSWVVNLSKKKILSMPLYPKSNILKAISRETNSGYCSVILR